ncbi:MAG: ABC transporter ATP-binding protein [Phycisphaerae bacterium]|nr:ABC transporter ATP-binding protein [Phycisphaerae bacterium]
MNTKRDDRWLPSFRRATGYLRPHRRALVIGLLAAVGVSAFYTFGVSSIIPVLKIIFAEHETLGDWLHRSETERRLGVVITADVPNDFRGLKLEHVRLAGLNADELRDGDRIVAIPGQTDSSYSYDLAGEIANHPGEHLERVSVLGPDAAPSSGTGAGRYVLPAIGRREVTLELKPQRRWWPIVHSGAQLLPAGNTSQDRFHTLVIVMAAVIVITLLGAVCRFVNEGLVAIAVQRAMHDVRTALADHALRLPVQWHSTQPPGDTLARFATDISKVEVGVKTLFGKVVREPLKAVGVLTLTLLIDWHMLLIGLVGLPIGVLVIRVFGKLVKRAQRRASQSWGRLLDHLGERLTGIRVVKAFNMQAAESGRFQAEGRELTRAQTHIELVDAASRPALETLASLAISAFILYGGMRVFNRELEPHLFFGAVICLGGIFDPLRKMGNVYNRLQAAEVSARRLFDIIDLPTEEPAVTPTSTAELPPLREGIEFRDVAFSYATNPDQAVLDGINLRIDKGRIIALVGPNGSGKTTLVSLLLRFFEPSRGRILIDGRNIADVSLASLRAQIGLVTQEAVIFSDTVRGNIAYGADGVSEEDIRRAARLAHVEEFVTDLRVEHNGETTTGYDARINARTLSGGQRQRIVLARAILRDPPILILDEATSQVDAESERKIQEALEDVTRDRTTIIIAHRFSTIARADLIFVLNEGRLVGVGRHKDLLSSCPFYENLVKTQFAK